MLSGSFTDQTFDDFWQVSKVIQKRLRLQRRHILTRRAEGHKHTGHPRRTGGVPVRIAVADQNALRRIATCTPRRFKQVFGVGFAYRQRVSPEHGVKRPTVGAPFATHASYLAGAGLPTLVFGPGSPYPAHTKDEWVSVKEIEQGTKVYESIMGAGFAE